MLKDKLSLNLLTKRSRYDVYLVPQCKLMPVATLNTIIDLAKDGDIIVIAGHAGRCTGF
jgi:hypothetical protein